MMNKISQVILKVLILFLLIQIVTVPTISYAGFWSDIFTQGDAFVNEGKTSATSGENTIDGDKIQIVFNRIYNILFTLGVVLTVIIGAALGIKFMVGSVEEQAKVKELLMPYVVGCIVILGAFGIWKLLITLLSQI